MPDADTFFFKDVIFAPSVLFAAFIRRARLR